VHDPVGMGERIVPHFPHKHQGGAAPANARPVTEKFPPVHFLSPTSNPSSKDSDLGGELEPPLSSAGCMGRAVCKVRRGILRRQVPAAVCGGLASSG
jgi:hypothetical protein